MHSTTYGKESLSSHGDLLTELPQKKTFSWSARQMQLSPASFVLQDLESKTGAIATRVEAHSELTGRGVKELFGVWEKGRPI